MSGCSRPATRPSQLPKCNQQLQWGGLQAHEPSLRKRPVSLLPHEDHADAQCMLIMSSCAGTGPSL